MTPQQIETTRADAVYLLSGVGYKPKELAAIFRTTRKVIRRMIARGSRAFKRQ